MDQETLHERLNYDPLTGEFTWLVGAFAGRVAGKINRHRGYRYITIFYRAYMAHRLAWLYVHGCWPTEDIDHINRVRDDNRIANLREATRRQNLYNADIREGLTGVKGITFDPKRGQYQARIRAGGKRHYLGRFDSAAEAGAAYEAAAKQMHGEFAWAPQRAY